MKIHQSNVKLEEVGIGEAVFVCTDSSNEKEFTIVCESLHRLFRCDYTWQAWRIGEHAPVQGILFRRIQ